MTRHSEDPADLDMVRWRGQAPSDEEDGVRTHPAPSEGTPAWLPDAVAGGAVALVGCALVLSRAAYQEPVAVVLGLLVALGMGAATACLRLAPGLGLLLVWVTCGLGVAAGLAVSPVQLAALLVAYGCGRYGSTAVLWASALSIPAGSVLALLYLERGGVASLPKAVYDLGRLGALPSAPTTLAAYGVVALVAFLVLGVPWLLGLLLRSRESAQRAREREVIAEQDRASAETGRAQAQEVAELRARQNQLARDVHDVVGHSLAVILAQAEAAQYLPADEPERLRETMANIAVSARQSLRDVRQVLATNDETQPIGVRRDSLDSLLTGVLATGNDVRSTVVGTPQPLPPELEVVAYRVLQEMLTNALKHGRRGAPVLVEQHWEGELRLEVRNVVEPGAGDAGHQGRGLTGIRDRLASVGGRCDVRRREGPDGDTFTVTAWLPVRG